MDDNIMMSYSDSIVQNYNERCEKTAKEARLLVLGWMVILSIGILVNSYLLSPSNYWFLKYSLGDAMLYILLFVMVFGIIFVNIRGTLHLTSEEISEILNDVSVFKKYSYYILFLLGLLAVMAVFLIKLADDKLMPDVHCIFILMLILVYLFNLMFCRASYHNLYLAIKDEVPISEIREAILSGGIENDGR